MSESITASARYVSTLNLLLGARTVSGAGPSKNVIRKLRLEGRRQLSVYCESLAIDWAFNSYSKNWSRSDSVNSFNDWIRETTTPRFTSCFGQFYWRHWNGLVHRSRTKLASPSQSPVCPFSYWDSVLQAMCLWLIDIARQRIECKLNVRIAFTQSLNCIRVSRPSGVRQTFDNSAVLANGRSKNRPTMCRCRKESVQFANKFEEWHNLDATFSSLYTNQIQRMSCTTGNKHCHGINSSESSMYSWVASSHVRRIVVSENYVDNETGVFFI